MLIIDKYTDYYDHVCHAYGGVDKSVVFDRRGSTVVQPDLILERVVDKFGRGYVTKKTKFSNERFLLEVGFKQWLVLVKNIRAKASKGLGLDFSITGDFEVERTFDERAHLGASPISLRFNLRLKHGGAFKVSPFVDDYWKFDSVSSLDFSREKDRDKIELPLLHDSGLAKLIPAEEIWKALETYVSAARTEKDVDIGTTDVEKAVNHGFDAKESFRTPTRVKELK